MTAATATRLPMRGLRIERSSARKPHTVSKTTNEYMRVSVS